MLILTRHPTQSILIADTIKITVISIDGNRVRLGIDAPRTTTIHRLKVVEAIEAARRKEKGE